MQVRFEQERKDIDEKANTLQVSDPEPYEDKEISDQEFVALLNASKNKQVAGNDEAL